VGLGVSVLLVGVRRFFVVGVVGVGREERGDGGWRVWVWWGGVFEVGVLLGR